MDTSIVTLEEPKFGKWRETHIDYSESRTVKSVSIETYLTFDELTQLVGKLMDAHAELLCVERER